MPSLAPEEVILQLRRPAVLYTNEYLNDPIKFNVDQRFIPETVLKQFDSISVVERDNADFIEISVGSPSASIYPVYMMSSVYNQDDYNRIIDKTFKQLIIPTT